jgi:hypothetical protein
MDEIQKAESLQAELLKQPQVKIDTSHLIHGQMYARTILVPANTVVVGALTNLDNICIVNGDITVTTDLGVMRLTGYHILPAEKGYKRIGLAHADTVWTTIIHTNGKTVDEIELEMTSEAHLLQTRQNLISPPEN